MSLRLGLGVLSRREMYWRLRNLSCVPRWAFKPFVEFLSGDEIAGRGVGYLIGGEAVFLFLGAAREGLSVAVEYVVGRAASLAHGYAGFFVDGYLHVAFALYGAGHVVGKELVVEAADEQYATEPRIAVGRPGETFGQRVLDEGLPFHVSVYAVDAPLGRVYLYVYGAGGQSLVVVVVAPRQEVRHGEQQAAEQVTGNVAA